NFGIVTVFGVFAGSLVTALLTGRFQLEGFQSPRHMLRSGGGAALMGAGGVMAFGCSIGQGLTGFSTLALASLIAFAGILIGTALRSAYIRIVIEVQAPRPASTKSYGPGPLSWPPTATGSSATISCGPMVMICWNLLLRVSRTTTLRGPSLMAVAGRAAAGSI